MATLRPAAAAAAAKKEYEFNVANARSERGKAHAAILERQTMEPLIPVPLAQPQRRGLLVLLALACALFAAALYLIRITNLLLPIRPHDTAGCRVHRGPVGSEDVALDARGVAFISADTRNWIPKLHREGLLGASASQVASNMAAMTFAEQGAIWAFDPRPDSRTREQMVQLAIEGLPASVLDLHPHGIAMPALPGLADDEPEFLYVVNHQRDGDVILVLEVMYTAAAAGDTQAVGGEDDDDGGVRAAGQQRQGVAAAQQQGDIWPPRLIFRGLMRHSAVLTGINDLVAPYPLRDPADGSWLHSVYVSNFLGSRLGDLMWMTVETFGLMRWGSVALCQARQHTQGSTAAAGGGGDLLADLQCMKVIEGINGPNGLALVTSAADGATSLFVACTMTMELREYALPQANSSSSSSWTHGPLVLQPLTLTHTLNTGSGLDNIDVDVPTGDLFIGAHPKPLAVAAHCDDPRARAPIQVLRIHRRTPAEQIAFASGRHGRVAASDAASREFEVVEVLLSAGEEFSGSSVGVLHRGSGQVIIGGVADDGVYVCPYKLTKEGGQRGERDVQTSQRGS